MILCLLQDILTELQHQEESSNKASIYGNISFDDVSFAYPSQPNTMVLSNFTLEVQRGETVAIVGSNGSGKVKNCTFL